MGTVQLQLECARCNAMLPHNASQTNHILHLLLSVITLGFWLPVWFIIGLVNAGRSASCARCAARRRY